MRLPALAVLALLSLALPPAPGAAQATGEGITVAVLDSGVDGSHPELAGRVERVSFTPVAPGLPADIGDFASSDPDGQGTAVASLVAGATLGVAPEARILDLQVSASYTGTVADPVAESAAMQAMDYLLQDPGRAQVVLLSFASRGVSAAGASTLASQAQSLADAGVVVLVPSAPRLSELHASASVVTVGAPDCPPTTSGTQSGDGQVRKPDLVAPANGLQAAAPGTPLNPGTRTTVSGTAFAAAQAAGAVARMLDARGDLPADAATALLRSTATDHGDPGADDCNGFGLLDAAAAGRAEQAAQAWVDPLATGPVRSSPGPGVAAALAAVAAGAIALRRRR